MTPTFCRFVHGFDLQPVDVNIDKIRYLEGRELTTAIHLDSGESIVVYGNAISVCMRVQDANDKGSPKSGKKAA